MSGTLNQNSVAAAEKALDAHGRSLGGIEGDASTQVWHLLASLHEYCVAHEVDLDAELKDVREQLSSGALDLPSSAEYVRAQSFGAGRKEREPNPLKP